MEFDLTNVSKQRVIENEFDVEDLELDGVSQVDWWPKAHLPGCYVHQMVLRLVFKGIHQIELD